MTMSDQVPELKPESPDAPSDVGGRRPSSCSGVHACQSLRAHMRARELMLRKEADRLHHAGAMLDAQAKKMIADQLDQYCSMLNRLEFDYRQNDTAHLTAKEERR